MIGVEMMSFAIIVMFAFVDIRSWTCPDAAWIMHTLWAQVQAYHMDTQCIVHIKPVAESSLSLSATFYSNI